MALTEKLELLLTADPTQGIAALRQMSTEAEKTAKSTTTSLQRIGTTAMKVGVGGMGVGGFLTQMASSDIEAANQLSAAIQQVGQSQSDYKDRIDDTVASQAKFGHTDEQVSGALTTLTVSYNDTGKALDQMQLVADLAARKHISLADAASMVARAHGGAGKLFKEFGIQVKENSDGTKDYDGALTELSQKLSGQAAASADSFGGKLREIRANVENLVSEFGQNFGPMILGLSTAMTALGGVTAGVGSVLKLFTAEEGAAAAAGVALSGSLATVSTVALPIIAGVTVLVGGYMALTSAFDDGSKGAEDYTAALKENSGAVEENVDKVTGLKLVQSGVADTAEHAGISLTTLFGSVREGTDDFDKYGSILSATSKDGQNLHVSADAAAASLRAAGAGGTEFGQGLLDALAAGRLTVPQAAALVNEIEALHNGYTKASGSADANAAANARVEDAIRGTGDAIDKTNISVDDLNKNYDAMNKAAEGAAGLADDLSAAMGKQYDAMVQPTRLASDYAAAIDDLADRFKPAADDIDDANRNLASSHFKVADAQSAVEDAQEKLTAMRKDGKSTARELADQERKIREGWVAVQDAEDDVGDSQKKLNSLNEEGAFTLDLNTEAGRKNVDAALATGDSIKALIQHRFDETHSQQDAIDTGNLYVQGLKDQMKQAGLTDDQVDQLIKTMGLTPEQITTVFSNNAVEQQIVIGKYLQQLKDLPPQVQTQVETLINQGQYDQANAMLTMLAADRQMKVQIATELTNLHIGTSDFNLQIFATMPGAIAEFNRPAGHKQKGGPVMAGSSYVIGEAGPELFTPTANGYITPNGMAGGYQVNIGQIVTADPVEAGDQVARRLRIEAMLATP